MGQSASPCFPVTTSLQRALRVLLSRYSLLPPSSGIISAWLIAMAEEFPEILLHLLSFWLSVLHLIVGSQEQGVAPASSQYCLLKASVKE